MIFCFDIRMSQFNLKSVGFDDGQSKHGGSEGVIKTFIRWRLWTCGVITEMRRRFVVYNQKRGECLKAYKMTVKCS